MIVKESSGYEIPYKNLKPQNKYKNQQLTFEESTALRENKSNLLKNSYKMIEKEISWDFAKFVYESFSTKEKLKIRNSGQQKMQGYYNPNTGELDAPNTQPTHERGIMVIQMWLQQDARCGYTKLGPKHILDLQVEHKNPEGGDYPENIVLVLANVNENRKATSMEKFLLSVEKKLASVNGSKEMYDKNYNNSVKSKDNDKEIKAWILSMSEDELADNFCNDKILPKFQKYVWRHPAVNMSSLSPFRLNTQTGVKRSGGSQGNYKNILNTISCEHLCGDKKLARNIYDTCRLYREEYLNDKITLQEYAEGCANSVATSPFFAEYCNNKKKLIDKIIKNNYDFNNKPVKSATIESFCNENN